MTRIIKKKERNLIIYLMDVLLSSDFLSSHVGNRFERASKGGRDLGLNVKAQKQRVGGSQAQK